MNNIVKLDQATVLRDKEVEHQMLPVYLPVPETTPQKYERVQRYTDVAAGSVKDLELQPVEIQLWSKPSVEVSGLKAWFSSNVYEALLPGFESVRKILAIAGQKSIEIARVIDPALPPEKEKGVKTNGGRLGLVMSVKGAANGADAMRLIIDTLFHGKRCRALDRGAILVESFTKEELAEMILTAKVLENNAEFPFTVDFNTASQFGGEEKVRDFFVKTLHVHDIWRDMCMMAGQTQKMGPFKIENDDGQSVKRDIHEIVHIGEDAEYEATTAGRFDRLALPIGQLLKHPIVDDITTIIHEFGHLLTQGVPSEFAEGITEFFVHRMAQKKQYAFLPDIFGGEKPLQIFPGKLQEGFMVNRGTTTERFSNYHAVIGWALAWALKEATGDDPANFRKLIAASQQEADRVDAPPDHEVWLRKMDQQIHGFKNRLTSTGVLGYQAPGKKVYWFAGSGAGIAGKVVAYEMLREESNPPKFSAKKIPLSVRIRAGKRMEEFVVPGGELEVSARFLYSVLRRQNKMGILAYIDDGFGIELQSPDTNEWKQLGTSFNFGKMDMPKNGDAKEEKKDE